MTLVTLAIWRARQALNARFATGEIDQPAPLSLVGRHAFQGWIACADPIESLLLELDGNVYDRVDWHERPDISRTPRHPHVTGWRVVIEVPMSRRSSRPARLVVNGRTALATTFSFVKVPLAYVATPDESSKGPEQRLQAAGADLPAGSRVLEVGTRQAVDGQATHHRRHFPSVARVDYVMCDVSPGHDVDIVGDLHDLPASWEGRYDAFVATAVFEHLERPWIAAREVARILKPGGFAFVGTHQCFPLHGYPSDFFRFSKEGLTVLFEDAGLEVLEAAYEWRAAIVAPPDLVPPSFHEEWNARWPSYIGVSVFATKPMKRL